MNTDQTISRYPWSPLLRGLASVAIVTYLLVMLLGPMTNPIGAPLLTVPMARAVAPIHQALFMGHGYRFFAPDPGPSHSVVFEITDASGETTTGHFPDREQTFPRLLYHRWFMLAESLFREGSMVPGDEQLRAIDQQYEQRIEEFRASNQLQLVKQLTREQELEHRIIDSARARRDLLMASIARVLMVRNQGESIKLAIQIRSLPTPEEVASGLRLDDASLVQQIAIGEFRRSDSSADGVEAIAAPDVDLLPVAGASQATPAAESKLEVEQ